MLGKHLDVEVDDGDPYNGKVKSEVRGYMRLLKGEAAAATDLEDLSGLDEFPSGPQDVETVEPPGDVDLDKLDLG